MLRKDKMVSSTAPGCTNGVHKNSNIIRTVYSDIFRQIQGHSAIFGLVKAY